MDLNGKKVLVVGLGKSGLAAAIFLRHQGARVTVSDMRSAQALQKEIPALLEEGIAVEAGGHGLLTFRRQDLIVVSPGVPLNTPELVQVRKLGLPLIGELELAARYLKGNILAITGSNGKTTTTTLCGEIMKAAHLPTQVGGNIGVPVIELVADSSPEGWSVLEVSSFQLETTVEFHPRIAVILNITPDHLDRHGSFENYVAAKERIFLSQTSKDPLSQTSKDALSQTSEDALSQTSEDALILNADDEHTSAAAVRSRARVFWFSRKQPVKAGTYIHDGYIYFRDRAEAEQVLPLSSIHLKGHHNVENVLAAVCATRVAGAPVEAIRTAVECFRAVEHRLEFVTTINAVDYYNDSKATNVDATSKAIAAFAGNIHLILGGKDKNSDYSLLNQLLRSRVKAVYTIGAAAEKIASQIRGTVPITASQTLGNAVDKAASAAKPGDIVLLAPACSSFDQFENYEQRGQIFKQLVFERQRLANELNKVVK